MEAQSFSSESLATEKFRVVTIKVQVDECLFQGRTGVDDISEGFRKLGHLFRCLNVNLKSNFVTYMSVVLTSSLCAYMCVSALCYFRSW